MVSRVHTIVVEETPSDSVSGSVDYVAVCSCGFETLPTSDRFNAVTTRCEIMEIELVSAKRRAARRALFARSA